MIVKITWSNPWQLASQVEMNNNEYKRRVNSFNKLPISLSLPTKSNIMSMNYGNRNSRIVCSNNVQPGGGSPFNSWQGWILGVVVSLIIPFWRNKWGPFLAIKNELDMVVDTVEAVAEVVEDVAERVEQIADQIGDNFPEDGKLKGVFDLVENVARETAKDAHILDQFIEQVEEVEERVESLFQQNNNNNTITNFGEKEESNKIAQDSPTTITDTTSTI